MRFVVFAIAALTLVACIPRDGVGVATDAASHAPDGPSIEGGPAIEGGVVGGACPGTHGPRGIRVEAQGATYCIDATEVTVGDYQSFLDATCKPTCDLTKLPDECSFKTSFVPGGRWPVDDKALPVSSVDFCDAFAFCAWAGKRLCGPIGGGEASQADPPLTTEWGWACAGSPAKTYPYGNAYDARACAGADAVAGAEVAVGSSPGCQGGFPGIFDLSGNVGEWDAACSGRTGPSDTCFVRGGGSHYAADKLTCASKDTSVRTRRNTDVGFRCCSF